MSRLERGLSRGRRRIESIRMRGTCTITRLNGTSVIDNDGAVTEGADTIYSGPYYCRYPGLAFEQNPDSVGISIAVSRLVVRIPFGTIHRPGDLVTVDADPDNPQLVGTVLRVASIDDQSQATAQRLLCEDFQAGVA